MGTYAGPQLVSGTELAMAASQALGTKMEFESMDECVPLLWFIRLFWYRCTIIIFLVPYRETAKTILNSDQGAEVDEGTHICILGYA